jgi:hypothetical protein
MDSKLGMDRHINAVHPTIPCPHCDRMFGSDTFLKKHIQTNHTFEYVLLGR